MDYYHQIFCRFRKCKRKAPPPSLLSNAFEMFFFANKIFLAIQRLFVQNFMYCNMKTKISDLKTFLLIKFSKVGLTTFVCESKTYLTFLNPRWLF